MNILAKLQEIFRDVFDDETIILINDTTQDDIEDWDSLAQINIIVAIKKEFKVDFTMEELGNLKSVGEIVKKIEEKL
jgi:acyl carrier protein